MATSERESREGFERWVDERIYSKLANLTQPFEAQIKQLQKRVEKLKDRFQKLSHRIDSVDLMQRKKRCRKVREEE